VGCHLERRGKWGKERPRLEISWSSTNYRLLNGGGPPYVVILNGKSPAKFTVVDNEGNEKEVSFKAKLPKRLKRLKTALGFGPYLYRRSIDDVKKSNELAPAFFLYGNLYMTNSTSLRFFDGFVWRNPSYFNNFGFYFAYNLADAFDGRIELVPLLGIQGLSFKLLDNSKTFTQLIYPQGFELIYKHAFGIENYNIVYGMFISTSSEVGYNNLWIRWGKGYFWELNYIDWEKNGKKAAMYGLSIGVPFLSFF
jgi:hypothetical protein